MDSRAEGGMDLLSQAFHEVIDPCRCCPQLPTISFPRCVSLCRHSAERITLAALPCFTRQSEKDRYMRQDKETFDAKREINRIRTLRDETRRRRYRKSRLDRYRAELVAMRRAGASCGDLAVWLRVTHRCRINRSSVDRYLKKLPELNSETVKTDQHTH
jgi:hypothetical protein